MYYNTATNNISIDMAQNKLIIDILLVAIDIDMAQNKRQIDVAQHKQKNKLNPYGMI